MNNLMRLWRTTTFRLTALFILIFVLMAVAILGYIAYQSIYLIQRQQVVAIERELDQLALEYRQGGTRGLVLAIQRFARGPGPGIYYVADVNGVGIAGNVLDVPAEAATSYHVGELTLDRLTRKVERGGQPVQLQPREFRLLEYLMKHAGQVVTRTMLLENVWDYHFDPQTNVIDVHISRLRSKIDKGFEQPLLHTVRGAGYVIRDGAR
ncbi:MAG TPA: winged helix-turn-helix domain-containing protein [Devosiaceae bacterium]|nr:winged helix-turn-helix domain-containing protein [Devosiaceae bacterium]